MWNQKRHIMCNVGWGRTWSGQPGHELAAVNTKSLAAQLVNAFLQWAVAKPDKNDTILTTKQLKTYCSVYSSVCVHQRHCTCVYLSAKVWCWLIPILNRTGWSGIKHPSFSSFGNNLKFSGGNGTTTTKRPLDTHTQTVSKVGHLRVCVRVCVSYHAPLNLGSNLSRSSVSTSMTVNIMSLKSATATSMSSSIPISSPDHHTTHIYWIKLTVYVCECVRACLCVSIP